MRNIPLAFVLRCDAPAHGNVCDPGRAPPAWKRATTASPRRHFAQTEPREASIAPDGDLLLPEPFEGAILVRKSPVIGRMLV